MSIRLDPGSCAGVARPARGTTRAADLERPLQVLTTDFAAARLRKYERIKAGALIVRWAGVRNPLGSAFHPEIATARCGPARSAGGGRASAGSGLDRLLYFEGRSTPAPLGKRDRYCATINP